MPTIKNAKFNGVSVIFFQTIAARCGATILSSNSETKCKAVKLVSSLGMDRSAIDLRLSRLKITDDDHLEN